MGKLIKLLQAVQKQEKKMKSLKPVTVDKKLLKESAEIVKNAGSFKKQAKLMDNQLKQIGEAELGK